MSIETIQAILPAEFWIGDGITIDEATQEILPNPAERIGEGTRISVVHDSGTYFIADLAGVISCMLKT